MVVNSILVIIGLAILVYLNELFKSDFLVDGSSKD